MKKTAEMLSLEADFTKVNMKEEYPASADDVPVICSLIK